MKAREEEWFITSITRLLSPYHLIMIPNIIYDIDTKENAIA
jgi:hypothetical protein